jgi:hypothetical protein
MVPHPVSRNEASHKLGMAHVQAIQGKKCPLAHLAQYWALVQSESQDTSNVLRHFPFSLAYNSHALRWYAGLPRQTITSWEDITEAFMARFYNYSVRVTQAQLRAVFPLRSESAVQFALRWIDTRFHCPNLLHPESMMVQVFYTTLQRRMPVWQRRAMPSTFMELFLHRLERPLLHYFSCNMVESSKEEEPDPDAGGN